MTGGKDEERGAGLWQAATEPLLFDTARVAREAGSGRQSPGPASHSHEIEETSMAGRASSKAAAGKQGAKKPRGGAGANDKQNNEGAGGVQPEARGLASGRGEGTAGPGAAAGRAAAPAGVGGAESRRGAQGATEEERRGAVREGGGLEPASGLLPDVGEEVLYLFHRNGFAASARARARVVAVDEEHELIDLEVLRGGKSVRTVRGVPEQSALAPAQCWRRLSPPAPAEPREEE